MKCYKPIFLFIFLLSIPVSFSMALSILVIGNSHGQVTNARTYLANLGHTVTFVSTSQSSYSAYNQVWDLRYDTNLTATDITNMGSYLSSGGRMYFAGEGPGFDASRNNSLVSFISSVGGGTLSSAGSGDSSQTLTAAAQAVGLHNTPYSLSTVSFASARSYSSGTRGFKATSSGSLWGWNFGDISGKSSARMLAGFDIEIFTSGQSWVGNMVTFLNGNATPMPNLYSSNTNFGNVRVGTSANATVTVTNTGTSGSTLTGTIGAATGSEFSPTSETQSFTLTQNQNSIRTYTYTPSGRGPDSTTIAISSDTTNPSHTLTGTGVSPVYFSSIAPDTTMDFGVVNENQTITQTLTIQNTTPDADLGDLTNLTLLSATISGEDASYFTLNNFVPGTVLSKNGLLNLLISVNNYDHILRYRNAILTIVTDENAALGIAGKVYTYQLTAVIIPEPSTYLFMSIAGMFFCLSRLFRKNS